MNLLPLVPHCANTEDWMCQKIYRRWNLKCIVITDFYIASILSITYNLSSNNRRGSLEYEKGNIEARDHSHRVQLIYIKQNENSSYLFIYLCIRTILHVVSFITVVCDLWFLFVTIILFSITFFVSVCKICFSILVCIPYVKLQVWWQRKRQI